MTRERAEDIVAIRSENDRRVSSFVAATEEEKQLRLSLRQRTLQHEIETRRVKIAISERIRQEKKGGVQGVKKEKEELIKLMLREQQEQLRLKQVKREEVQKRLEEARIRRAQEREEQERRMREFHLSKAREEEFEALRAEKLVRVLEEKEKEWIARLQETQRLQEATTKQIEMGLLDDTLLIESPAKIREKIGLTSPSPHRRLDTKGMSRDKSVPKQPKDSTSTKSK